jgi:dephospho-CoA kinase
MPDTPCCSATTSGANEPARDSWVAFKRRLADVAADLEEYGWVKDAATDVLMLAAERWAEEAGWVPGRGAQ